MGPSREQNAEAAEGIGRDFETMVDAPFVPASVFVWLGVGAETRR